MDIIAKRFVVDESWDAYTGEMSRVMRAVDMQNGGAKVAIKIFDKDAFPQKIVMEAFSRECESLQALSAHPHIVTLIDIGRDDATGCNYLALEWCDANLLEHLARSPEPEWSGFYRRYGADILDALRFAYSQDVLHRDIKPQNVLINSENQACVTDFGISKFRRYYKPGVTLAHYKSKPYAPPEDSTDFPDTRDVYSFAVLCLECIAGKALEDYPDVEAAARTLALPDEIREILIRCVSRDPTLRPANIVALAEEIESATAKAVTLAAVTREIPVHLTAAAVEAMQVDAGLATSSQAGAAILRELNEICGIDELEGVLPQSDRQLGLLTAEYRFRSVPDMKRGALTIIGLSHQNPSRLERLRDKAWQPLLRFQEVRGRGDTTAIDWLSTEFDEFLAQRRVEGERRGANELFDGWSTALRAKDSIQLLRKDSIRFTGVEVDGQRLILRARHDFGDAIIGQQRLIRLDSRASVHGEIERTDGDTIWLYCGPRQKLGDVPALGELELDLRQSQTALKRQTAALDAVKFGRSTRPDLRDLLTGKKQPEKTKQVDNVVFFQEDLDPDKKAGVCAALEARDLLVVEGHPGTGKTKFITELVAQVLTRSPGSRILITSQTHVALDHALANVENLAKANGIPLRAVRIARRGDEKVSTELDHLLLDSCVAQWLQQAMQRSEQFLVDWAGANDISPENVRIGMALADLRVASAQLHGAQRLLDTARSELGGLESDRDEIAKDRARGDDYRIILADIREKQTDIDDLDETVDSARHTFQAAIDRARGFPDLAGQIETLSEKDLADLEHDFIHHSAHGPRYRQLLQLAEEWRQRFGQSADFHGAFVSDCDVIGGTCLGIASPSLQSVEFDLCIVDEASKATPTEILVPMSKAKKWIVVGDPNQLPPFVDESPDALAELERHEIDRDDARRTLLDHFIETIPKEHQVSLLTQHRMVRPIGDLVSECFYSGTLKNVNENTCQWLARSKALPKPVTWLNTAENPKRGEHFYRGTYVNETEVEAIERLLLRLQFAASQRKNRYSVALLSGYGGQVAALDRMARAKGRQLADLDIETGTVDSYQGREADVAVYSITRSNDEGKIGFLKEHERLNVALSRAKLGLAIVGDTLFCDRVAGRNPFGDVLSYIRTHTADCAIMEA